MTPRVVPVAFDAKRFFEGVRYVGRVQAQRAAYHVYDVARRYLLLWPSSRGGYFVSEVPRPFVDKVRRTFRKRRVTVKDVGRRLRAPYAHRYGALIALVARKEAALDGHEGRSLRFRVYA
jgi:hypothetical protein